MRQREMKQGDVFLFSDTPSLPTAVPGEGKHKLPQLEKSAARVAKRISLEGCERREEHFPRR